MNLKQTKKIKPTKDSFLKLNQKKLHIVFTHDLISHFLYQRIGSRLKEQYNYGKSTSFEDILYSYNKNLKNKIQPVLNKELFKYNQLIIKLSQQLSKNKTIQRLKISDKNFEDKQAVLKRLQEKYAQVLKQVTHDYLKGFQKNIDEILLTARLASTLELNFLHKGAQHLELKAKDRKFGKIAVDNHYSTQEIIDGALDEQTRLYRVTRKTHIIGDILVNQQYITSQTRDDILLIQNRIMEEDWEEVLKKAGTSSIEEKEKNALFGALVLKEKMLAKEQVIEALKIQDRERQALKDRSSTPDLKHTEKPGADREKVRWIGDILVNQFGLSEYNRNKIVKKQMVRRFEHINLKFGLNISSAQQELFDELEKYFHLFYSEDRISAFVKVLREIPETLKRENIILWLHHKNISFGRIDKAVNALLTNQVGPGQKTLLAEGKTPVPDTLTYELQFNLKVKTPDDVLSCMVHQGKPLVQEKRHKGEPGINVHNAVVLPPTKNLLDIVRGKNVLKSGAVFKAECDGIPWLSEKNVISVSSDIKVPGDIIPAFSPLEFDCDFEVQGCIQPDVKISCCSLTTERLYGKARCSGNISVLEHTRGADITAQGTIRLSVVNNSTITSEKSIIIHTSANPNPNDATYQVSESILTCNDIFKIDADIASSIIRARNRIIFTRWKIGPDCKFIAGDSLEIIALKKKIEEFSSRIQGLSEETDHLKQRSFEKSAETKILHEKKIKELKTHILTIYRSEPETPEMDFRKTIVPKGCILQFPHNIKTIESDLAGFLFREVYNEEKKQFEIKMHRW
ncbi:MAG: flagellar assembly protein A [Thermodesulfobacteriota bacterium]|nr:flagellar assembly protein A [Thermodesulfobacteriota bacterium]